MNDNLKDIKFQCESCKELVTPGKLKTNVLPNKVHEAYHNCTACNHKHISYYTNDKIRRDINRLSKLRQKYSNSKTTEESRMHLARINTNDKLIETDMNALKDKMTKALA